ncbi:GntR family transcriptional regulator [Jiella mangrovi]|uniref:GntR family transcriptional regulator n=1 Tax=Jiella mangrovi TaxID=2821407 RepID=A0ABS4BCD2_9HYPH|nr:GntR family transcriptional regulator [Jiella mangrovi]MBP0614413.1 GntR family transcriptional regulator [Jiella mangrovi]
MQATGRWADDIYAAIIERMIAGELSPGDALNELPLAEEFGVSRTPVREALQRLSAVGLVERGRRRAFVVKRLDPIAIQDLFEAVGELAALVAGMAALRMNEVERQALAAVTAAGEKDGVDYAEANARFHELIQQGAHNCVLASTIGDLSLRTLPWRGAQLRAKASRVEASRREHRAILDAILARDSAEAAALMRAHIGASFVGIVDMVRRRAETLPLRGPSTESPQATGRRAEPQEALEAGGPSPLRQEPQRNVF